MIMEIKLYEDRYRDDMIFMVLQTKDALGRLPRINEDLLDKEYNMEKDICEIYQPTLDDLWFRQSMMADPETMSYNHAWGGIIQFPENDWKDWYDYWVTNHEHHRYYRYLKNAADQFVGEIAYHYDEKRRIYVADVIIHAPYRGNGYGGRGLELLCAAAKENGVTVLYDDIAIDNPAVEMFLKHGFREEYHTDEIIMLKKEL